jgi:enoyl-CoA hydratase/3-hydroxyacyl-CoA dehydrogenase
MSQINKIGVIGAGNMGSGIAQKIAQEGLNVVVVDIKDEYVERGLGIIKPPWPMRTLSSRRSSKTSR